MRLTLLLFIFSVLILSGCADKRYLNAGDKFIEQGQYQQAVLKYQRALVEQPDDKDIIAKLEQAQNLFDIWLDKIELSARQAEENNHFGKAQLLYAKLAKHRNNQSYKQKNRDLRQRNLKDYGLKIKLSIADPQLAQRFNQQLDHISFIQNIAMSAKNEMALTFSLSEIIFDRKDTSQLYSKDYISHYDTVANPDYQYLQESIIAKENAINSLQIDLDELQHVYDSQSNILTLLEKDRQILELTMSQSTAEEYDRSIPALDVLNNDIQLQQQTTNQIDNDIYNASQSFEQYGMELNSLFQSLQQTSEYSQVAAYSAYEYRVRTVRQLITSQLKKVVNKDVNAIYEREHLLQIEDSDKYHEAHPTIALSEDPLTLKSQAQLTEDFYTKGREKIITLILSEVDKYQQELIAEANNVSDIGTQLDRWLIAGSISKKGLPSDTNNKVVQQLQAELGLGGTLNISELLNAQ